MVSYLVRPPLRSGPGSEPGPAVARYDLLEAEDSAAFAQGDFRLHSEPPAGAELIERAFVYCRWVVAYKPRRDDNSALALKLTAENLFLTLAAPDAEQSATNTPLLQFLALMLERKKLIKLRGLSEDGQRQIYEHMPSHQLYEVPVGDLNMEFFQKIQEHLGVLVGTPKPKAQPAPAPAVVVQA
ncbi:MAG: hypothetical protein WDM96_03695 [Lacunisphaera sp.]